MACLTAEEGMKLLQDPKYSDFTIICGGYSFVVHKNIITAKSEYFARCVDGQFKEALESKITITDATPHMMGAVLIAMYTGVPAKKLVNEVWPNIPQDIEAGEITGSKKYILQRAKLQLGVYSLADLLGLQWLMEDVNRRFINHLEANWKMYIACGGSAEVFADIFRLTRPDDTLLRANALLLASEYAEDVASTKALRDVIKGVERFSFTILLRGLGIVEDVLDHQIEGPVILLSKYTRKKKGKMASALKRESGIEAGSVADSF